jgi:hypothetical protein
MSVCLGLVAVPLRAQPRSTTDRETKPFRVAFSSTTSCRDPSEFVEQLQRRTGRLRVATATEKALTFQIALSATPAGVEGELLVEDAEGVTTTRQVPGLDCHEVISAMALIGALMVDPLAAAMAPPSPPRSPQRLAPPPTPAPAPAKESPWSLVAGLRFTLDTGVAPKVALGGGAFVELGHAPSGLWAPSARLSAARTVTSTTQAGELGSAEFTWTAGRLAACPLSLRPVSGLTIGPCALFELGWLHAAGVTEVEPAQVTTFVPSTGAELAAAFRLFGPVTLGAELGVLFHLVGEKRYYFLPQGAADSEVFVLPTVGISGRIGLGVRFF